ncbi:MAG: ferric reductase-like transmembrane domain-containing protein, partial [Actinomycetota bacterium]
MSDQVWWYATRAAGLMTWSTAMASVIVGLLLSTRAIKSRTGPWMLDLHRFLGGISVLFLVVHVVTLYLDSFVDFGPRELFVPGESTWNTEAAAWGIIAMYALVLVELTSLLRKRMSQSVWRTFHMLSVVTAIAGTYHAILGGSDVDNPLTWVVAGAGSAIVIALVALRLKGAETSGGPRSARANDREALLQEMRDRLETLPIPDDAPMAELLADGATLPRRERGGAPGGAAAPTVPT